MIILTSNKTANDGFDEPSNSSFAVSSNSVSTIFLSGFYDDPQSSISFWNTLSLWQVSTKTGQGVGAKREAPMIALHRNMIINKLILCISNYYQPLQEMHK
eukprot:g56524.t1